MAEPHQYVDADLLRRARVYVVTEIGAIESSWEAYPWNTRPHPDDVQIHANAVALLAQIDEALK